MLILFLNELSVATDVLNLDEAQRRAVKLVKTLRKIRSVQRNMAVNSELSLKNAMLDQRYSVSEALSGNEFKEEWLLLKDIADRHPFAEGLGQKFDPEVQQVGYDCRGREAIACGWADQLGTAVISFVGAPEWSDPFITVSRYEEDDSGEIQDSEIQIYNFSETEHIAFHEEWLQNNVNDIAGYSVDEFWDNKENIFPNLRFLDRVKDDLLALEDQKVAYRHAVARLIGINKDITSWIAKGVEQGEPEFSNKTARGEHDQRRDNAMWLDLDNVNHYFGKHQYFDPKRFVGRLHFRISQQEQKAIVAYIGRKLGT